MEVHPNSLENLKKGKRFSKTYKPNRTGRRKNYLKKFIDDNRLSINDLKIIFENLIMDCSFTDLEQIFNNGKDTLPAGMALLIRGMQTDLKRGSINTLNSIIDRVYGKTVQQVNITEKRNDIPDDPAERKALIEKIEKELAMTTEDTVIIDDENK
jgi:uncharacterized protein YnzC (UPF0291/DUF896 family)